MSKPSFSNIDLWLFELAEGNLSEAQIEELEMFLLNHPELDIERDAWEMAKVDQSTHVYEKQDQHMRRKPVAMYSAIGATAIFMISVLGCYQYYNLGDFANSASGELISNVESTSNQVEETKRLALEVNELKVKVAELEEANRLLQNNQNTTAVTTTEGVTSEMNANENNRNGHSSRSEVTANSFYSGGTEGNGNISYPFEGTDNITATSYDSDQSGHQFYTDRSGGYLRTHQARPIDFSAFEDKNRIRYYSSNSAGGASTKRLSMKTRLDRMARSIQRMMDNPIALKNSRDPHYHIPGVLPQDVNFGAVGTLLTTRVQTLSRLQWLGTSNEQLYNQIALDGYSYGMRGGFGVQLGHTMLNNGGVHVGNVALTYSPKFSVSNVISVEPSIRMKMGSKLLDHNQMDGVEQVEMNRGNVEDYYPNGTTPIGKQLWYKDLGAGLMVNTKWFFAGVQADNLFNHQDNIFSNDYASPKTAPTEVFATIGTDWESKKLESRNKVMTLSPYLVYHSYGNLDELWLGMNYRFNWITVGGAISSELEPAASVGMKFKHFAIQYNADYSLSRMMDENFLSHQLTLKFLGKTSRVGKRIYSM